MFKKKPLMLYCPLIITFIFLPFLVRSFKKLMSILRIKILKTSFLNSTCGHEFHFNRFIVFEFDYNLFSVNELNIWLWCFKESRSGIEFESETPLSHTPLAHEPIGFLSSSPLWDTTPVQTI